MREGVVMYSGGTDSTAAVILTAESFERMHLLTYKHSGLSHVENSGTNIRRLREVFPQTVFLHRIIDIDALFRLTTYSNYIRNIRQYGFFNLGSCGLCKLAMHMRTLLYCVEHRISEAIDGSNKNMTHFPAQMRVVLEELRAMYKRFGITFSTPVFDYEFPDGLDWLTKLGVRGLASEGTPATGNKKVMTTGRLAYEKGVLPAENVKGTPFDRKMQARCFQLTLLNAFALGWFIPRYGPARYEEKTLRFYRAKIDYFTEQIERYLQGDRQSRFAKALVQKPYEIA